VVSAPIYAKTIYAKTNRRKTNALILIVPQRLTSQVAEE
jgi:hypothetical protein